MAKCANLSPGKDTFGAYQAALQGSRQARKQVFCDDDWLEFRGADDADPVWQAQNPFAEASPPLMRDTHEGAANVHTLFFVSDQIG